MTSAARPGARAAADPVATYRELVGGARSGELPRLVLLMPPERVDEEPWFAERILAAAREWARSQPDVDLLDLDGGSPDFQPQAVDAFLGASSLFGGRRALLLGRATRALEGSVRLVRSIAAAAARPDGPLWSIVQTAEVVEGSAPRERVKLWHEAVAGMPEGTVRIASFRRLYGDPPPWNPHPDQSEAARFAAAEARERGLTLSPGAAGTLVELVGADPGDLVQGLEHLVLMGLQEATEDEVRRVVAHAAEGNALDFADAVLCCDAASALRVLGRLEARGLRTWDGRRVGPEGAFGLLAAVLAAERRRTAAVRAAMDRGASFAAACQGAGVAARGPAVERMRRRMEHGDAERLRRILSFLREAEREVKVEGRGEIRRVLELLVLRTCPLQPARRAGARR